MSRPKHWDGPPREAWEPWCPADVAARLAGVDAAWCVVGGCAIDLFLGRQTREHGDLEISIPRFAFAEVRARLAAFVFHAVGAGEVHALEPLESTPIGMHQNWVLDTVTNAWRLDVMLEPGDAETWVYRRDERIREPRASMIGTRNDIPFLVPEAVLLYKAKGNRAKDDADLASALPELRADAADWLRRALEQVHPGHPWIARLHRGHTI